MAAVEGTGGLPEEVPRELRTELARLQRQIKVLLNNYQVILKGQLGDVFSPPEKTTFCPFLTITLHVIHLMIIKPSSFLRRQLTLRNKILPLRLQNE